MVSIDKDIFKFKQLPQVDSNNFRSGKVDSWRKKFSKKQFEESTRVIPKKLFKIFGWKYKNKVYIKIFNKFLIKNLTCQYVRRI